MGRFKLGGMQPPPSGWEAFLQTGVENIQGHIWDFVWLALIALGSAVTTAVWSMWRGARSPAAYSSIGAIVASLDLLLVVVVMASVQSRPIALALGGGLIALLSAWLWWMCRAVLVGNETPPPALIPSTPVGPTLKPPDQSREARALAALKASEERAKSEAATEVSKPVKLKVGEVPNATHLVLGLELLTPEPTDHYALHVLDVARWHNDDDGGSYSTIARFAESAKPWEISRWSGATRLHRDAGAAYNLCTFANGPHVEHIAGRSRTTCKLAPGLYRFKLEFRRGGHVHPHESFVRVDTKAAEFVGHG